MVASRFLPSHQATLSKMRVASIIHHPLHRTLPSRLLSRTAPIISQSSSFASTSTSLTSRPFQILGLQQVAIGALDKSPLSNLWTNIFGTPQIGNYKSDRENVDEDILLLGKKDSPFAVEVDLMMPIDEGKSPKVHVPSLNHIGLWVDDLPAAVAWMESQGVRFTPGGIRKGASGHNVTFIHPKGDERNPISGEGVLIELVQAPKNVIDAYTERD